MTLLGEYSFKLPIRVRFRDTDMMGHVNNAVYLTYFEAGRIEYWITLTGNPALEDLPFILARTEIDFLAEARAAEELTLGVRAGRLGNKSFDLEYLLVRDADGKPVARGRSVQVMFDYESKQAQPLDDETRRMISEFEGARVSG
ncbi:MAG: acyl-CoA thioesterase [Acidobacteria bacterium]|nr:acyl-CoA thioesterase [Acidobacteriota bacterium]